MDEKQLILGQYQIYNHSKEKFIDRHFATNRFYMILTFIEILVISIFVSLNLHYWSIIVIAAFGMAMTALWWLNLDSYQFWIKIKYAKVLEYLESKLPEQPFNKEYAEFYEAKKRTKAIVFSDFQKIFTVVLFIVNLFVFTYFLTTLLSEQNFF